MAATVLDVGGPPAESVVSRHTQRQRQVHAHKHVAANMGIQARIPVSRCGSAALSAARDRFSCTAQRSGSILPEVASTFSRLCHVRCGTCASVPKTSCIALPSPFALRSWKVRLKDEALSPKLSAYARAEPGQNALRCLALVLDRRPAQLALAHKRSFLARLYSGTRGTRVSARSLGSGWSPDRCSNGCRAPRAARLSLRAGHGGPLTRPPWLVQPAPAPLGPRVARDEAWRPCHRRVSPGGAPAASGTRPGACFLSRMQP